MSSLQQNNTTSSSSSASSASSSTDSQRQHQTELPRELESVSTTNNVVPDNENSGDGSEDEDEQGTIGADGKPQTTFINESSILGKDDDDLKEGVEKKGGRRKINIEFIENKSRRHVTFSKRKHGLIKKV